MDTLALLKKANETSVEVGTIVEALLKEREERIAEYQEMGRGEGKDREYYSLNGFDYALSAIKKAIGSE